MKAQLPDEEKVAIADFLIDNSGSLEHTESQVDKVMQELHALAAAT
jgi:dephospho-CoA kinase